MQFQTAEVAKLAGLTPVAGVYKLEEALKTIQSQLDTVSPSSVAYKEWRSLQQQYTQHLNEAKQLRQRGMASFQKYLANKSQSSQDSASTSNHANATSMVSVAHHSRQQPPQQQQHENSNGNVAATVNTTNDAMSEHKAVDNDNATQQIQELKQQNAELLQQIESLMKNKSECEETEHDLRVILEEYKFGQLSHKQELNELKNSALTYKKASEQKTAALEALTNEYETAKNNNTLIAKQNTQLKQRITQFIDESTNLKQQMIETRTQCEQLEKEKQELVQKLKLSQKLNHSTDVSDAQTNAKENVALYDMTTLKPRLQKVYNMVAELPSDVDYTAEIQRELQSVLQHIDDIETVPATSQTTATTTTMTTATTNVETQTATSDSGTGGAECIDGVRV